MSTEGGKRFGKPHTFHGEHYYLMWARHWEVPTCQREKTYCICNMGIHSYYQRIGKF